MMTLTPLQWPPRVRGHRIKQRYITLLWIAQAMLRAVKNNHPLRWSREHLYPRCRYLAGSPERAVIVLAHRSCNTARGNADPTPDELTRHRRLSGRAGLRPPFLAQPL